MTGVHSRNEAIDFSCRERDRVTADETRLISHQREVAEKGIQVLNLPLVAKTNRSRFRRATRLRQIIVGKQTDLHDDMSQSFLRSDIEFAKS